MLKEIRSRENKYKRTAAAARKRAREIIEEARREAVRMVEEARQEGAEAGRTEAEALLSRTENEIAQAERESQAWVEAFNRAAQDESENLLRLSLDIVLGRGAEGNGDDS